MVSVSQNQRNCLNSHRQTKSSERPQRRTWLRNFLTVTVGLPLLLASDYLRPNSIIQKEVLTTYGNWSGSSGFLEASTSAASTHSALTAVSSLSTYLALPSFVAEQPSTKIQTKDARTAVAKVAYLVALTDCSIKYRTKTPIYDVAAVLKRSVERQSYPLHPTSRYEADFFLLVAPDVAASSCAKDFEQAGWVLRVVDLPVLPNDVAVAPDNSSFLKNNIAHDGCCGHKELIKLHAYTMDEIHPMVVHLDLDTLVLQPLDELFNAIYYPPTSLEGMRARQHLLDEGIVAPTYEPVVPVLNMTIEAFYSKDYNIIKGDQHKRVGIQGGFFVVRTNMTRYKELVNMVRSGNYVPGRNVGSSGWFGSGYGSHIWGSLTIQGLMAYYYDMVVKDSSVELHRCQFNQIADNPRVTSFHARYARPSPRANKENATWHDIKCRDGRKNCDDVQCQTWPISKTRVVHYTYCKLHHKYPWECRVVPNKNPETDYFLNQETCRQMNLAWFQVRKDLRGSEPANGAYHPNLFHGYCKELGKYMRIQK